MGAQSVSSVVLFILSTAVMGADKPPSVDIAGIPFYNPRISVMSAYAKQEFVVALRSGSTNAQVHALCGSNSGLCLAEGHPDQGGIPFITVNATLDEMTKIMHKHKDVLEFVEPSLDLPFVPIIGVEHPEDEDAGPVDLVQEKVSTSAGAGADSNDNVGVEANTTQNPLRGRWNLDRIDAQKSRFGLGPPNGGCTFNCAPSDNYWKLDGRYNPPLDGRGSHIYVVDTGVRTTHKDFGGRAVPTIDTSSGKLVECDPNDHTCAQDCGAPSRSDECGHGTHCAGTVAGSTWGAAKAATIHSVKAGVGQGFSTSAILKAFDWVAANGTRPAVISASLGANVISIAMRLAVQRTHRAGVTVVVAAGNDGDDACKQSPAETPQAITVGSTSQHGPTDDFLGTLSLDQRSPWSNYGPCVDIHAPGHHIKSVSSKDDTASYVMSGTSMATPLVAGVVAMFLQICPTYSPDDIDRELKKFASFGKVLDPRGAPNLLLNVAKLPTTRPSNCPSPTTPPPPTPPPPNSDLPPDGARRRAKSRRRSTRRRRTKSRRRSEKGASSSSRRRRRRRRRRRTSRSRTTRRRKR